jgi:glycosyltransferase involved in cell wall biosynthesis
MKKFIIIVPAYNEEEKIQAVVTELLKLKPEFKAKNLDLYVYIINDGSKDKTYELAQAAGADRIVQHKLNRGLGAAVRTGLNAAKNDGADIVLKFDADLQHNPQDVYAMIKPILDDEADVVYGYRFEKIAYKMPFVRRVGNLVFTGLMRWLTGWPVYDSQPGIIGMSSSYLKNFYIPGDYNYTQQILLDSFHKGMRFQHVKVEFRKRETGKSFISFKYPFKVLPQIIQIIIGVRPLKFFGPIGMFFMGIAILTVIHNLSLWIIGENNKIIENVNLVLGSSFMGIQTLYFGLLADMIVKFRRDSQS